MNKLKNLFFALLLACLLGVKAMGSGFDYGLMVDGRNPNPEVVVKGRSPVISWTYDDPGYPDNSKKRIRVKVYTNFNVFFSSYTEEIDEDVYKVEYSSTATALKKDTTYYLKINILGSDEFYLGWSDTATFITVYPEIEINENAIDLKIDWNNPFYSGEVTKIRYSIPQGIDQKVFLSIYSPSGRMVKILVNNEVKISDVIHTEYWDGKDESNSMVGSGIYLVHLRVDDNYKTVKVCFIR